MGNLSPRTFYVDIDDLKRFNEISTVSASEIVRSAIKAVIDGSLNEVEIDIRLDQMGKQLQRLAEDRAIVFTRLESLDSTIESITTEMTNLREERDLIRRTARLSSLSSTLNKVIIANHYNEEVINELCSNIISQIVEIRPSFNLAEHIARMKIMLDM